VPNVIDAQNGRVLFNLREADDVARLIAEHKDDPDFSVELRITYTAKEQS
jgi:hypothetical protein